MNVTGIIIAAAVVGIVGIVIGVLLGIASEKFKVEVDEREELVRRLDPEEGKRRLVVYNKTDIGADASLDPPADIRVSAKTGENIAALRQKMLEMSMEGYAADAQFLIEERHYAALQRALEEVRTAHALCGRVPLDLLGVHLKAAWEALGEITGETANERIIDEIFSKFCVGK